LQYILSYQFEYKNFNFGKQLTMSKITKIINNVL